MAFDSYSMLGIYGAAVLLGAAHALEPGHGKTVVAAYLVGSRGRNIDALLLGIVVTFTHSFSIILLGLAAKVSARYLTDQELHGYLGIVASLLILVIGIWLIKTRWQALHDPSGSHGHRHFFHRHSHDRHHHHEAVADEHEHLTADGTLVRHSHGRAVEDEARQVGLWGLIGLGVSGGIVPCPAALALLLASVSVGNLAKGLILVVVFSLGLAAALVTIGLLVVNGVRLTGRFLDTERHAPRIALASAVIVTLVGIYTLYSSVSHFTSL
jgi:nickel/cobalt transporter (NicO) family protein